MKGERLEVQRGDRLDAFDLLGLGHHFRGQRFVEAQQQHRFPDISFGRTYVNLTVRADAEEAPIGDVDWAFTAAIDALIP